MHNAGTDQSSEPATMCARVSANLVEIIHYFGTYVACCELDVSVKLSSARLAVRSGESGGMRDGLKSTSCGFRPSR